MTRSEMPATRKPQRRTRGKPTSVDAHVGRRIQLRRMLLGMSQEKLGEALDLTFQQIQKYENGSNRISAGRLHQLSRALQVPVSYFFEGLDGQTAPAGAPEADMLNELLRSQSNIDLLRAYGRIPNPATQHSVRHLVRLLAGDDVMAEAPDAQMPGESAGRRRRKRAERSSG